jgi:hypothetical protein
MDISEKYASSLHQDHKGARAALVAEIQRHDVGDPQKELARFAEPNAFERLETCSAREYLRRVSAESRAWGLDVQAAIAGKQLTSDRLLAFQECVQRLIIALTYIIGSKPGTAEADEAHKLRENLTDPAAILERYREYLAQEEAAHAQTLDDKEQLGTEVVQLRADKSQLIESVAKQATTIERLSEALLESVKKVEAQPEHKPAASKKRETQVRKPNNDFRLKALQFTKTVEKGVAAAGEELDVSNPPFRSPDLWKVMDKEGIFPVTQAEKTLNYYASEVLKERGFNIKAGRPAEVAGVYGVDFLLKYYQVGLKVEAAEGKPNVIPNNPPCSKVA